MPFPAKLEQQHIKKAMDPLRHKGFNGLTQIDNFGEAIALAKERMDQKNIYFTNPAFDK